MTTATGTTGRSLAYVLPRPATVRARRAWRRRLTGAQPTTELQRRLAARA